MTAKDGDGWVDCTCGQKHWGLFGAAGLALVVENKILLQHRAPWVHNGDTWGIPGGARDSHENVEESALREATEEIGIDSNKILVLEKFVDSHGMWSYTTIIATLKPGINSDLSELANNSLHNSETSNLSWVDIYQLDKLNLHPSFAKTWNELLPELEKIFMELS